MNERRPRPSAEVDITHDLVQNLVASERPDLADLELVEVGAGWDNSVWKLGSDLAVRVPRREAAVQLLVNEQAWLPGIAPRLPLPVPVAVVVGRPSDMYPWPWSICQWVPGCSWAETPPVDETTAATSLGRFLRSLHTSAADDAPVSPFRGGPLVGRDAQVRERALAVSDRVDVPPLLALWDDVLDTPGSQEGLRTWVHGDLHPLNLACDAGELSGVLDFGDLTAGDPAVDLSAAWTVFDAPGRAALFAAYEADDHAVRRAAGWAINHGFACVAGAADDPQVTRIGEQTLARLAGDPPTPVSRTTIRT